MWHPSGQNMAGLLLSGRSGGPGVGRHSARAAVAQVRSYHCTLASDKAEIPNCFPLWISGKSIEEHAALPLTSCSCISWCEFWFAMPWSRNNDLVGVVVHRRLPPAANLGHGRGAISLPCQVASQRQRPGKARSNDGLFVGRCPLPG